MNVGTCDAIKLISVIFEVRELLTTCGAEEFITMFAKKEITFKEITFMEDKDLREVSPPLR